MQKGFVRPTMQNNYKRICTEGCIYYSPTDERCTLLQMKVSPIPKQGYKLIVNCREYRNGWSPDYQKHLCKNSKCEGKPMGVLSTLWGSNLLSVMYKCVQCGRIDGEIWDISEQKLIVENIYMKSRYGDDEDLIESLTKGGIF